MAVVGSSNVNKGDNATPNQPAAPVHDHADGEEEFHMPAGLEPAGSVPPIEASDQLGAEPYAQPAPVTTVEEVVAPVTPVIEEPAPTPAVEETPAVSTYPETTSDAEKALYGIFEGAKVDYNTMNMLLGNVLQTGDLANFDIAAMGGILGPQNAAVAKVLLGTIQTAEQTAANESVRTLYETAGGQQQFNDMSAWAKAQGGETADLLNSAASNTNQTIQKVLTGNLMAMFKASPQYKAPAQLHNQEQTPANGIPNQDAAFEPITQREYAESLYALRKQGGWDGENYAHPKVKALVNRLNSSKAAGLL